MSAMNDLHAAELPYGTPEACVHERTSATRIMNYPANVIRRHRGVCRDG